MLLLGSRLNATPVMSLQTGGRLAHTTKPIINPANLRIIAYEVEGQLLTQHPSFLRTADVREFGRLGMIIDSNDEIIGLDDVLEVERLYKLDFGLIGMQVIDDRKHRLGKVLDYTLETNGFEIQQLNVRQGFFKSLNDTGSLIHRSQIVEINDKGIVVKSSTVKTVEPMMQSMRGEFVNPFRKANGNQKPEPETTTIK